MSASWDWVRSSGEPERTPASAQCSGRGSRHDVIVVGVATPDTDRAGNSSCRVEDRHAARDERV